jgi:hypothetical protein
VDDRLASSPTALVAFYHLATREKLLLPAEWQARAIDAEQHALELAAKLAVGWLSIYFSRLLTFSQPSQVIQNGYYIWVVWPQSFFCNP